MIKIIKKVVKKQFTKNYWQSSSSSKWHNKRQQEAYADFNAFALGVSNHVKALNYKTVIEIGTGAGTLISLISKKLDNYNKFIGIDINKQQINENKKNYQDSNIEFICMDIDKYIKQNNLDEVVIVAQNTFDYFDQASLTALLKNIHTDIDNVVVSISGLVQNKQLENSVDRQEADLKVYHHNYHKILSSVGFKNIKSDSYGDNENSIVITAQK